jgi:hypothetical protein
MALCFHSCCRLILFALAALCLPILYITIFLYLPYYELAPFEGRVVDADTKEPIEGAAVLAVYYDDSTSIAGSNTYPIDAHETQTDIRGDFRIPEVKKWFGGRPGTVVEARLIIFKPGYGLFPSYMAHGFQKVKSVQSSGESSAVYELPRLTTLEKRWTNLPSRWNFPEGKST